MQTIFFEKFRKQNNDENPDVSLIAILISSRPLASDENPDESAILRFPLNRGFLNLRNPQAMVHFFTCA